MNENKTNYAPCLVVVLEINSTDLKQQPYSWKSMIVLISILQTTKSQTIQSYKKHKGKGECFVQL